MWVDLEDVFYQLKAFFFPPFELHSRSHSQLWKSISGNGNGNGELHSQIFYWIDNDLADGSGIVIVL